MAAEWLAQREYIRKYNDFTKIWRVKSTIVHPIATSATGYVHVVGGQLKRSLREEGGQPLLDLW